jgi:GNAT superfamily N-acetyltransferase
MRENIVAAREKRKAPRSQARATPFRAKQAFRRLNDQRRPTLPRTELRLALEAHPDKTTVEAIEEGLAAYNEQLAPGGRWAPLWLVGRDSAGAVQAGLKAITEYDWLFVNWLWVAEPYRRQGIGSRLLSDAEAVARERGCTSIYLDTFSFQAPDFYRRLGFKEFGRLSDFPPGHTRFWLSKPL